jgi:FdhD protein
METLHEKADRQAVREVLIHRVRGEEVQLAADEVAVEEPLELRLRHVQDGVASEQTICVTMRTPGHDVELAVGYLYAEQVIHSLDDLARRPTAELGGGDEAGILTVEIDTEIGVDVRRLQRNVFTSSSCGVCGTPSLDALAHAACPDLPLPRPMIDRSVISMLPEILLAEQEAFRQTGGLHAAALFEPSGRLLRVREDVGRHNAMDKLIGSCLLEGVDLTERIVLVSGRTSYELVQKALVAGIPVLAAVGAPSSLAVSLAQAHGLTLLGFVRGTRYNVYHGEERFRSSANRSSLPARPPEP